MSDIAFDWRDLIVILLATAFLSTLCSLLLSLKDKVLKSRSCTSKNSRGTLPEVPEIVKRPEPSKPNEIRLDLTEGGFE
jgi:hypothetical protein